MFDFEKLSNADVSETVTLSEASVNSYYTVKRLSNSDLDLINAALKKKVPSFSSVVRNFELGTALHCAILEPDKYDINNYENIVKIQLQRMIDACLSNSELSNILKYSPKEVSHFFDMLDMPCKARFDILDAVGGRIVDIKTTSCLNKEDFIKTVYSYNYDRQMAFYSDSVGVKKATLVAVSKVNFEVFFIDLDENMLNNGRKKYNAALHKIKELNLFDKIMSFKD